MRLAREGGREGGGDVFCLAQMILVREGGREGGWDGFCLAQMRLVRERGREGWRMGRFPFGTNEISTGRSGRFTKQFRPCVFLARDVT